MGTNKREKPTREREISNNAYTWLAILLNYLVLFQVNTINKWLLSTTLPHALN